MLQNSLCSGLAVVNVAVGPVESQPSILGRVRSTMKNVAVVKNDISWVQIHRDLASDELLANLVTGLLPLFGRSNTPVGTWNHN